MICSTASSTRFFSRPLNESDFGKQAIDVFIKSSSTVMIGLGEDGFTFEISSDSFMLGEFKSVIECNVMDKRLERFEKRNNGLICQRDSFLAMGKARKILDRRSARVTIAP